MDKDTFKKWLAGKPDGRNWLAEKCDVDKSTVNGWCSNRKIPGPAMRIIESLVLADSSPECHITLPFTAAEYALIEHATHLGSFADTTDFARFATKQKARQITDSELAPHGLNEEGKPAYGGLKKSAS